MRRFVWRLQRVLDIKAKQEQTKRAELLELTERLARVRGELLIRERILMDIIDGLRVKGAAERLGEQEFFLRYSASIDEQIKKLKERERQLQKQQMEKIAEVLRLKRFKEGLERLRDEAKRNFIEEQEKLEQKDLDEVAIISFAQKIKI